MKNFSLVQNDGRQFPELPNGLVMVYGFQRNAVAYCDYEGLSDRPTPEESIGEWFPLSRDFDSTMAWHGERKKLGAGEQVFVQWRSPRKPRRNNS